MGIDPSALDAIRAYRELQTGDDEAVRQRQEALGKDLLTLEGCVEWAHPEQTRRETLLAELARLRRIEAAAEAVSAGVDSADTAEANLLRALDAALDGAA